MSNRIRFREAFAPSFCAEPLEPRRLLSAAKLATDLNKSGSLDDHGLSILGTVGGITVFFENDGTHGIEPWRTNGTAGGTYMLRDINPGPTGSDTYEWDPVVTPKFIYFGATLGKDATLWRTDGTVSGTIKLRTLNNDLAFASDGNRIFFTEGTGNDETFWTSDGTVSSTHVLGHLIPSIGYGNPNDESLAGPGGAIYFAADDGVHGNELWKSDGTVAGTEMVADLTTGSGSTSPQNIRLVGPEVFFTGSVPGQTNPGLFKTDGTSAGTKLVSILPVRQSEVGDVQVAGQVIYFDFYETPDVNDQLWRSDGTSAGTFVVGTFPGVAGIDSADQTANRVYVSSDQGTLWSISGHKIKRILSHLGSSVTNPLQIGSTFYFEADDGDTGEENIWRTEGTISGTKLIKTFEFQNDRDIGGFTAVGNELYFIRSDGTEEDNDVNYIEVYKPELWKSDGTADGTMLVKKLHDAVEIGLIDGTSTSASNRLIFPVIEPTYGQELWQTTGTAASTHVIRDISPATAASSPSAITAGNGGIFFYAQDASTSGVWFKPDKSDHPILLISNVTEQPWIAQLGNREAIATETHVWISNGTQSGTTEIFTAEQGTNDIMNPTIVNGSLYFSAKNANWKSDGTPAGTVQVKKIPSASNISSPSDISVVSPMQQFNGATYFVGFVGDSPRYKLIKSDGTTIGTSVLFTLPPATESNFQFAVAGGELYLLTRDGELWKTDGTTAGTQQLHKSSSDSFEYPLFIVPFGRRVLFGSGNGEDQLWISNGHKSGTKLLKAIDLNFVIDSDADEYAVTDAAIYNGILYFAADDGTHGIELWDSDGTSAGTKMIQDINPGDADDASYTSSWPQGMTISGGTLYFSADDGLHGRELWELPLS